MRRLIGILSLCVVIVAAAFAFTFTRAHAAPSANVIPSLNRIFGTTRLHIRPLAGTPTYQNGFAPSQIRGAYNLPSNFTGAGITIAIVDAFDLPTAAHDFDVFSTQFGLPTIAGGCGCFQKVNQNGAASPLPALNAGW